MAHSPGPIVGTGPRLPRLLDARFREFHILAKFGERDYQEGKRCMLVVAKPEGDFSRGCVSKRV
jgi:hypothetical protein